MDIVIVCHRLCDLGALACAAQRRREKDAQEGILIFFRCFKNLQKRLGGRLGGFREVSAAFQYFVKFIFIQGNSVDIIFVSQSNVDRDKFKIIFFNFF